MKSAPVWQDGYTIVEVMIFLVISAELLLSVTGIFTNRISNTQFTQALRGLDSKVRTIANSAATGTIPANRPFNCTVPTGGEPTIAPLGSQQQGMRTDCVFAGKIINFNTPSTGGRVADTYTVLGRRIIAANGTVSNSLIGADGAKPRVITNPDITESYNLGNGTSVSAVYRKNGASLVPVSAIGFFQSFNGKYEQGKLSSGSQGVETWTVTKAIPPVAPSTIFNIDDAVNAELLTPANEGVLICLRNGPRKGSITLGASNAGTLTTTLSVGDTQCP